MLEISNLERCPVREKWYLTVNFNVIFSSRLSGQVETLALTALGSFLCYILMIICLQITPSYQSVSASESQVPGTVSSYSMCFIRAAEWKQIALCLPNDMAAQTKENLILHEIRDSFPKAAMVSLKGWTEFQQKNGVCYSFWTRTGRQKISMHKSMRSGVARVHPVWWGRPESRWEMYIWARLPCK